ncbi:uncharacterized protein M6D78_002376 [Vipera latastei]
MVDFRRILPPDMEMGPNPSSLAGEFLSTLAEEKKQDTQQELKRFTEVVPNFLEGEKASTMVKPKVFGKKIQLETRRASPLKGEEIMLEIQTQTPLLFQGGKTAAALGARLFILEDVAVHFTRDEWALLKPDQKALHGEVMEEIGGILATLVICEKREVELFNYPDPEAETQILWPPNEKEGLTGEEPHGGKD